MRKLLLLLAAVSSVVLSCIKEAPIIEENIIPSPFSGTIEQMSPDTKVYLDENRNIRWSEGDEVIIFNGSTIGKRFRVNKRSVGRTSASFDQIESSQGSGFSGGSPIMNNVAFYPFNADIYCEKADNKEVTESYLLTDIVYSSTQTYAENSFGPGANAMVAVTSSANDYNLVFLNINGGIRLKIKGSGTISKITIEGNNGEKLSGNAAVKAYVDGSDPEITFERDATTTIALDLGQEGIALDAETAKDFLISVPPTVFSSGFKITLEDINGFTKTVKTSSSCEVSRSIIMNMPILKYAPPVSEVKNLAEDGKTANSYIVSSAGTYKFPTVQGNSTTSVGSVASVEVLWETFGTDTAPSVGDLVKNVTYADGYISFEATSKKGNASIAAKDTSGKILWSWHIWLTDQPEEQVYYNNAGTMMDRNLGATSATPGDVEALGLLYQWGRKDPFLGGSAISYSSWENQAKAASTISWPEPVASDASNGTIAYVQANPTIFLTYNSGNGDWFFTGSSTIDNYRWQSNKTIYDPCPPGWRVPDGGDEGVWSKTCGSPSSFYYAIGYDNKGREFSKKFGPSSIIWYPSAGYISCDSGQLNSVGSIGSYRSVTCISHSAYELCFNVDGSVEPSRNGGYRSQASSVRCCKEGTTTSIIPPSNAKNLAEDGKTANSYIVPFAGAYKFPTVRGNSTTSVGEVASVEVLWETFGTDTAPAVGDLVKNVSYADGYISFEATSKKGNASIAAKDTSGKILWSWHIWLTDQPEEQVYYNNAGTMMDRNLGATSATPGDVEALGLMYQWGRKDPFLGASGILSYIKASSTLIWPEVVELDSSNSAIDYSREHPTTFIKSSKNHSVTYWDMVKTIYDPCPPGWKIPRGDENGVWSKATGSLESNYPYDSNKGINFSGKFGDSSIIWYPSTGYCDNGKTIFNVGHRGSYWSVVFNSAYAFVIDYPGYCYSTGPYTSLYLGYSVRCQKE